MLSLHWDPAKQNGTKQVWVVCSQTTASAGVISCKFGYLQGTWIHKVHPSPSPLVPSTINEVHESCLRQDSPQHTHSQGKSYQTVKVLIFFIYDDEMSLTNLSTDVHFIVFSREVEGIQAGFAALWESEMSVTCPFVLPWFLCFKFRLQQGSSETRHTLGKYAKR